MLQFRSLCCPRLIPLKFLLLFSKRDFSSEMKMMGKNQTLSYSLSNFLHSLSQLEKNLFCQTTSFLLVGGRFETKQNKNSNVLKRKFKKCLHANSTTGNSQFHQYFRGGKKTRSGGEKRNSVATLHQLNSEPLWRCLARNTAQNPCAPSPACPPCSLPCLHQPRLTLFAPGISPPLSSRPALPSRDPAPPAPELGCFRGGVKLQ